jgi:hypothetical protein
VPGPKGRPDPRKAHLDRATNFLETVEETYRLVGQYGCKQTDLWYSDDGLSIRVDDT